MAWYYRSAVCGAVSVAAGIAVDIDHLFDYYAHHRAHHGFRHLYDTFERADLPRFFLVLHSYELIFLFWAAICLFSLGAVWVAAAIGMTQHLICDRLTNPIKPFGYFLTYRAMKRFRADAIIDKDRAGKRC